jgi:arginine/lysine/ornithine decarboxylase
MDHTRTPLFDALLGHIEQDLTPFFIPSHMRGRSIHPKWKAFAGENIFKMDLSELVGLDDLHQPHGAIREAEELAASAWRADESFFLVNGTSSGIVASINTAVSPGEKILIPRNVHKSVIFGLILSGAIPVYLEPEIHYPLGLIGGISPAKFEKMFVMHPDIKAAVLVSPTYHGICSDVKRLAKIAHAHGAVCIADEAHGSHMYFHEALPQGAIIAGADIACQSTHKMSGSLTQSSMLHLRSDAISRIRLRDNLRLTTSTSPSYILMASLDLARSYIATNGHAILDEIINKAAAAREIMGRAKGIGIIDRRIVGESAISDFDPIRFVLSARELGITGYDLHKILREDYRIEAEFGDYYHLVCVMGLGTQPEDIDRITAAVLDISEKYRDFGTPLNWDERIPPMPPMVVGPRDAYYAKRSRIPWSYAKGRVCAEMIVPYPPGIPIVCPGERITYEVWDYLEMLRSTGRHIHSSGSGNLINIDVLTEY